jgi:hypothetical protein
MIISKAIGSLLQGEPISSPPSTASSCLGILSAFDTMARHNFNIAITTFADLLTEAEINLADYLIDHLAMVNHTIQTTTNVNRNKFWAVVFSNWDTTQPAPMSQPSA